MNESFKNTIRFFRSGLLIGFGITTAIIISIAVYATYAGLGANPNDPLSASKWNELLTYTIPPNAIMAFSGTVCPNNWSEYLPARGRFLRGIDSTGVNDTINRPVGNIQEDNFKSHNHMFIPEWWNSWSWPAIWYWFLSQWYGVWSTTSSTGGTETRPKNAAVLFCIKN